jgi:hypothetical protein
MPRIGRWHGRARTPRLVAWQVATGAPAHTDRSSAASPSGPRMAGVAITAACFRSQASHSASDSAGRLGSAPRFFRSFSASAGARRRLCDADECASRASAGRRQPYLALSWRSRRRVAAAAAAREAPRRTGRTLPEAVGLCGAALHPDCSGAGSGCGAAEDLRLIVAALWVLAAAAARVSTPPPAPEPERHNTHTAATLVAGTGAAARISACAWTLASSWRICRTVAEPRTAAPLRSRTHAWHLACARLEGANIELRRSLRRVRDGCAAASSACTPSPALRLHPALLFAHAAESSPT